MYQRSLKDLFGEGRCILAPCVYDAASARAVELVGFEAMMFSGGEFSLASHGLVDDGFNNLTDVEAAVSRIAASSTIPLAVDIEGGYGGPVAVHRTAKRLARVGAAALQLEDAADLGKTGEVLPREQYYAKVRAAVAALEGTDTILIARTNVDPAVDMDEAIARCLGALENGAHMTTVVKLANLKDAETVATHVPGWKMYPDASASGDQAEVELEQVEALGYNLLTVHFLLKAAMEGMLAHARENLARRNVVYTVNHAEGSGLRSESATPLFEPQELMRFEAELSRTGAREYRLGAKSIPGIPDGFRTAPIEQRF